MPTNQKSQVITPENTPEFLAKDLGILAKTGNNVFLFSKRHNEYYMGHSYERCPLEDVKFDSFYGFTPMESESDFRNYINEFAVHLSQLVPLRRRERFKSTSPELFRHSPWGLIQDVTAYTDGIYSVGTPGHGGFMVSREVNNDMHPSLQLNSRDAEYTFYEEDNDYARVVLSFPDYFTDWEIKHADLNLKNANPDAWEAFTGKKLKKGESRDRDATNFLKENAQNFLCVSAINMRDGSDMVLVTATLGGNRNNIDRNAKHFLVSKERYEARTFMPFVIDHNIDTPCDEKGIPLRLAG